MRNLKYLLAVAAIGGLVALPQTSLAAARGSKAEDYSYLGGNHYSSYGYYPYRRHYRRYYDDDYHSGYYPNHGYYPYRRHSYPYRRHHYPYYGGPFIGGPFISFGFGFGGWDD